MIEQQSLKLQDLELKLEKMNSVGSSLSFDEAENLMISAVDLLGEKSPKMAKFYYGYAKFLLKSIGVTPLHEDAWSVARQHRLECILELSQENEDGSIAEEHHSKQPERTCGDAACKLRSHQGQLEFQEAHTVTEAARFYNEQLQDFLEVCECNFTACINICQQQWCRIATSNTTLENLEELTRNLVSCRCGISDLMISQNRYEEANKQSSQALHESLKLSDKSTANRLILAQVHRVRGDIHHHQGSEEKSMEEWIEAAQILIGTLRRHDNAVYPMPTIYKPIIDRIEYMSRWDDSKEIHLLKSAVSQLLDRIELQHALIDKDIKRYHTKIYQKVEETTTSNRGVLNLGTVGNASTSSGFFQAVNMGHSQNETLDARSH